MNTNAAFLENGEVLCRIYGVFPKFDEVNLHNIKLDWNGPIAILTFDLADFPKNPPEKWKKLNTIQIDLSFFPLISVDLRKFGRGNKCDILPSIGDDGLLKIIIQGDSEGCFTAISARVDKVSAYFNQR